MTLRHLEWYAKGCDAGLLEACMPEAGIYITSDRTIVRDMRRMAAGLQRECEAGEGYACSSLGEIYAGANSFDDDYGPVARDAAKARHWYEKSCSLGHVRGCVLFADLLNIGGGGPKDSKRAYAIWTTACDAKDDHACLLLGAMYEKGGDAVAKDDAKARAFYERSCKLGQEVACERLH